MIIDPNQFALSVVQSSSPELTIQDKITLYKEAYTSIEEHNKVAQEQENKQAAKEQNDFLYAFDDSEFF